jgi:hypothetical protein
MMNRQALRQKNEKKYYVREKHEHDLRQRMRMIGGANTSASKNQKERGAASENSPKEDNVLKWPQIFKGWRDLTFGHENRHRMAAGELFLLLGILGASPKVLKRKTKRKKGTFSF